jgi:hypothetical protein
VADCEFVADQQGASRRRMPPPGVRQRPSTFFDVQIAQALSVGLDRLLDLVLRLVGVAGYCSQNRIVRLSPSVLSACFFARTASVDVPRT